MAAGTRRAGAYSVPLCSLFTFDDPKKRRGLPDDLAG